MPSSEKGMEQKGSSPYFKLNQSTTSNMDVV